MSLYNQTGETAILPTPVVAVLGVIDDVTRRTPSGFVAEGQQIYLLGTTREELSGSEWAHVVHGHLGGLPPQVDLAAERSSADILVNASRDGLIDAAHDLSDGGLAQALVESCLRNDVGARVWLPDELDPFVVAVQRVGRAGDRRGAAVGGGAVHRHVQRPRLRPPAHRRDRRPRARRRTRRAGPVLRPAQRPPDRLVRHPPSRPRLTPAPPAPPRPTPPKPAPPTGHS